MQNRRVALASPPCLVAFLLRPRQLNTEGGEVGLALPVNDAVAHAVVVIGCRFDGGTRALQFGQFAA